MRLLAIGLVAVGMGAAATYARAEDAKARYTMTPVEKGVLKLDTVTGATSFCTRTTDDWSCKLTPDGDQILRRQIEGLQAEIVVLKEQLTKMETVTGLGNPGKADPPPTARLPTEKDVDQAFDYVESMVKKLRERLSKIERENKASGSL